MYSIRKNNILLDVFSNINDYVEYIDNPKNNKHRRENASQTEDKNFTGTSSYEEARDLLQFGDEKTLDKIKKIQRELKIDKLLGNNINKKKSYMDVVGYQPCVPLFLNGVPNCMISDEKTKTDFKILNLYLNFCVSARVRTGDLQKAGAIHAMMIDLLEKKGYRINLYVGEVSTCDGETIMNCIKVKTDREPLNLKKLAFAIANPSMLRRIGFKYTEVCESNTDFTNNSYGTPVEDENRIKNILSDRFKTEFMVFSYQNIGHDFNIENMIKKIEEKGIHLNLEETYEN